MLVCYRSGEGSVYDGAHHPSGSRVDDGKLHSLIRAVPRLHLCLLLGRMRPIQPHGTARHEGGKKYARLRTFHEETTGVNDSSSMTLYAIESPACQ